MAREAVSLLEGGADALASGTEFREALALLHSSQDLGDGGALLAWVDHELENARRFARTGDRTDSLVRLDSPLPLPAPAMQLDAVCEILKGIVQEECTQEERQTAKNAVRMLMVMDDLEVLSAAYGHHFDEGVAEEVVIPRRRVFRIVHHVSVCSASACPCFCASAA